MSYRLGLEKSSARVEELKDALREAIREELTSGNPAVSLPIGGVKSVKQELSNVSIPANGYRDVDVEVPEAYSGMMVTCRASYGADATAGVRLIYLYSHDGVNYDGEEDAIDAGNYADLTFAPGQTRQRSEILAALPKYVRVRVRNKDLSAPVTVSLWRCVVR